MNLPASSLDVEKQYSRTKVDNHCNLYDELHISITKNEDYDIIDAADKEIYFMLYTRSNPKNPQYLIFEDERSVRSSNYRKNKPLSVVVHGWISGSTSEVNTKVTEAFLAVMDCNVIVVDWNSYARTWYYPGAVEAVPKVGRHLGEFLHWLINTIGGHWNRVHLVGHSLGAHVVGNAGRRNDGRASRLTGLDPAGPLWLDNPYALRKTDAQYVEAIHTDGGYLGKWFPVGHADFYPNGGRPPQPGCPWFYAQHYSCIQKHICSHSRSYLLFAASIQYDRFFGNLCENLKQAEKMQCHGRTFKMGNAILSKRGNGIYGLRTTDRWPFYE